MQQRATGGRYGCHLENMTSSQKPYSVNDAYLLEEQSCQILSLSDLSRRSLIFFEERTSPKQEAQEQEE